MTDEEPIIPEEPLPEEPGAPQAPGPEAPTPPPSTPPAVPPAVNRQQVEDDVAAGIEPLLGIVDELGTIATMTNGQIQAATTNLIRTLAADLRAAVRQNVRLSRLAVGVFDSANDGGDVVALRPTEAEGAE